jgi:hypothetical protein
MLSSSNKDQERCGVIESNQDKKKDSGEEGRESGAPSLLAHSPIEI